MPRGIVRKRKASGPLAWRIRLCRVEPIHAGMELIDGLDYAV